MFIKSSYNQIKQNNYYNKKKNYLKFKWIYKCIFREEM